MVSSFQLYVMSTFTKLLCNSMLFYLRYSLNIFMRLVSARSISGWDHYGEGLGWPALGVWVWILCCKYSKKILKNNLPTLLLWKTSSDCSLCWFLLQELIAEKMSERTKGLLVSPFKRTSMFLTHPVFNRFVRSASAFTPQHIIFLKLINQI